MRANMWATPAQADQGAALRCACPRRAFCRDSIAWAIAMLTRTRTRTQIKHTNTSPTPPHTRSQSHAARRDSTGTCRTWCWCLYLWFTIYCLWFSSGLGETAPVHGEHCVGVCVGHEPACSRRGCARRVSARCQLSCKKTPPFPSKHRGDERNGAAAQNRSDVRAFVRESMRACLRASACAVCTLLGG
jgi:hypothetical protein